MSAILAKAGNSLEWQKSLHRSDISVRYFDKSRHVTTIEMELFKGENILKHESGNIVLDVLSEWRKLGSPKGVFRVTVGFEEKA